MPIDAADLQKLGERLRALRHAAGETQEQTANSVGLTRTYLTEIESGRKNITLSTLYALANHFKIEPAGLLRVENGRTSRVEVIPETPPVRPMPATPSPRPSQVGRVDHRS